MSLRIRALLTAAAITLGGVAAPAAAMPQMDRPEFVFPTAGEGVNHGERLEFVVDHSGSRVGRYRLTVTCRPAHIADAATWTWSRRYYWSFADSSPLKTVKFDEGLAPNSDCSATLERGNTGVISASVSFHVVWNPESADTLFAEPPTRDALWPHPVDGRLGSTFTFDVRETGDYTVEVISRRTGRQLLAEDLGSLEPGRHDWAWDGRRPEGGLPVEGGYTVGIRPTVEPVGSSAGSYRDVLVRIGPAELSTDDLVRERQARHVDIKRLNLYSDSRRLRLAVRFASLRARSLSGIFAAVEVAGARKSYFVDYRRKPNGTQSSSLLWAPWGTDVRPKVLSCRRLRVEREGRVIVLDVPRRCMSRGGPGARAHAIVSDRHGHYDEVPGGGRFGYWTSWVKYETP